MAVEESLILVKPDGMARSLTGNILTEMAKLDFDIVAAKIVKVDKELAEEHYASLRDKPFFDGLVRYLMGGFHRKQKVMALVYRGEDAIQKVRDLIGNTNPNEANPISIRGKFGRIREVESGEAIFENVLHASSCPEDAEREINLWFRKEEIID